MIERGFEIAQQLRQNRGAIRQFAIQRAMEILKAAGVVDPNLEVAQPTTADDKLSRMEAERAPQIDLRQRTYELLTLVRQPSDQEKETLGNIGFVFLPIEAKTLAQVVSEDPDYFRSGELNYINSLSKPALREYVPPVMSVVFNPAQLFVPDSFRNSQAKQLVMTEEYSHSNFETVYPGSKVLMLPASVEAQADRAYFRKTGKVLFTNCFARALDQTSGVGAAGVGRGGSGGRLNVRGWVADRVSGYVGAPLAVVFLRK